MARKRPRRSGKLREQFVNPPSQSMPPEIFHALFLDEDERNSIKKLKELRRAIRRNPLVINFLKLRPQREAGRPVGSYTINWDEATAIAFAIGTGGLTKGEVLRTLAGSTGSDPYRWLDRRLKRAGGAEAWKDEDSVMELSLLKPIDRKRLSKSFLREIWPKKKVQ